YRITPRIPPISSPPPALPGPPCTNSGRGETCPVDSLAQSLFKIRIRLCWVAAPKAYFFAARSSAVTIVVHREPFPFLLSSMASSAFLYGIIVLTGPKASTSCGSGDEKGRSVINKRGD